VEQPSRIANLIGKWLINGWCRETIFNLKLPMKKRYQEVMLCLENLAVMLAEKELEFDIQAKTEKSSNLNVFFGKGREDQRGFIKP